MIHKYIYLCTPQSSGTWWAIKHLRNHPEVGGITHPLNLMYHLNKWALVGRWNGNPHNESLSEEGKVTMIYSHYGDVATATSSNTPISAFNRWIPQQDHEWIMMVTPTLSPLRDPLIGMIRAWHRESMRYPHDNIMDNYIHIAKRGNTLGVNFWRMEPVDKQGFFNAVKAVGFSLPQEWVDSVDFETRVNNTPGECSLREDYNNGDIKAIAKKLPIPWRRLQENEPVLRPFYEKYGFKDLLWWS